MLTPSDHAPTWTAPRLVALGTASDSQAGPSRDNFEDGSYYPSIPV